MIDDSSDEDAPQPGEKRSRSKSAKDAKSTSCVGSSPNSKRARVSTATGSSQGSEEGEVEESQDQAKDQAKAAKDESVKPMQPKQPGQDSGPGRASLPAAATSADATPSVTMPLDPPMWSKGPQCFKLPAFSTQREGSWLARFNDWVHLFYHNNLHHGIAITSALVLGGYTYYLDNVSGIKSGKRKSGKKAAHAAEKSGALAKTLKKLRAAAPHAKAAKPSAPMTNGASRQANGAPRPPQPKQALENREPRAAAAEIGQPNLNGDEQLPSDMSDEKFELTDDEGRECCFCGSTDPEHVVDDCRDHWARVYPPDDMLPKVVDLPITCAICASREHFLSECSQRVFPPNPTWSLANRSRFIDPDCGVLCIEDAMKQRESQQKTPVAQPTMRGPMAQTSNVHYSESDDTEIEFLGNRIVRQQSQVGQMRISTNIQTRNASRLNQSTAFQLPQPVGPPPSGPRRGQPTVGGRAQRRTNPPPRAPVSSLPAKPPPPSRGYHGVAPPSSLSESRGQDGTQNGNGRGGHGKRGGQGARGRGKGRGRAK